MVLRVKPTRTRFPTNILFTHLCIVYQVCDARGAAVGFGTASRAQLQQQLTSLSLHRKWWVVEQWPILVSRIFHPGRSHGCSPDCATGGSLLCGRYLLAPLSGKKKGARALWYSALSLHQLCSRPTVFIPRWTAQPCILYQVCATRGYGDGCAIQFSLCIQDHLPLEVRFPAQKTPANPKSSV